MRKNLVYKVCIVCVYVFLFWELGIANGFHISSVYSENSKFSVKYIHSTIPLDRDTLNFEGNQPADSPNNYTGSTGLLLEMIGRGINTGFLESDYLVGIYKRHIFKRSLFGEGRLSIGMIEDNVQKTRFIPAEYRLNYSFRQNSDSPSLSRLLSPYLYLGAGIIYHKPVEVTPPIDPRTVRLEGRLPSTSLFDFKAGLTPTLPVGVGMNIRLDPSVNLNLQFSYKKVLNRFAIHGNGFHRSYLLGFTIGLNFKHGSSSKPYPVSDPWPFEMVNPLTLDQTKEVEEILDGNGIQSHDHIVRSNAFNIVSGEASQISFGQHPTNTIAGELIRPPVSVRIEDRLGNLVNVDNKTKVTLALSNESGIGSTTLMGTTTVTTRNGVATFDDLRINAAGEDFILEAIAPGLTGTNIALLEKPTHPATNVGFNMQFEIDSVKTGQCYYSVQFGSYQTMGSAFSAIEEAQVSTGHSFKLYFNRRNGLYMVRTSTDLSLSETVLIARNYKTSDIFPDVAVVSQCYEDSSVKPLPISYQIQFGSFLNPENAAQYAEEIRKTYGISISVLQTMDDQLFRVRTRPYTTISEARQVLEMLKNKGGRKDLFLSPTPETTRFAMNFEYDLHVGSYLSTMEAFELVEKLRSQVGFKFRVVVFEEEGNGTHLFLDARYLDWKELMVIKKKIESIEFNTQPSLIHLMENMNRIE